MPPTKPTFGQHCAKLIMDAKAAALAKGGYITARDVARIIDEQDSITSTASSDAGGSKTDFGDRKAIPPTPAQVEAYSASICYPLSGTAWCDFYEQKGWSVGRTRMKDWQAAVRNWKTNGWRIGTQSRTSKDYTDPFGSKN